jgi:hypothetical protein
MPVKERAWRALSARRFVLGHAYARLKCTCIPADRSGTFSSGPESKVVVYGRLSGRSCPHGAPERQPPTSTRHPSRLLSPAVSDLVCPRYAPPRRELGLSPGCPAALRKPKAANPSNPVDPSCNIDIMHVSVSLWAKRALPYVAGLVAVLTLLALLPAGLDATHAWHAVASAPNYWMDVRSWHLSGPLPA